MIVPPRQEVGEAGDSGVQERALLLRQASGWGGCIRGPVTVLLWRGNKGRDLTYARLASVPRD